MKRVFEMEFEGRHLQVEIGEIAKQAAGACLIRYDDTVVLSTVCAAKDPKEVLRFELRRCIFFHSPQVLSPPKRHKK